LKAIAFDILYALNGRAVCFKAGPSSVVVQAACAALQEICSDPTFDQCILRQEPAALVKATTTVRDEVAKITSTHDKAAPQWETQTLINKICAVTDVKIFDQTMKQWSRIEIGQAQHRHKTWHDFNKWKNFQTSNQTVLVPFAAGTTAERLEYGRDLQAPHHIQTAFFCLGKGAAKRQPLSNGPSNQPSPGKAPHDEHHGTPAVQSEPQVPENDQHTTQSDNPSQIQPSQSQKEEQRETIFNNYTPLHQLGQDILRTVHACEQYNDDI